MGLSTRKARKIGLFRRILMGIRKVRPIGVARQRLAGEIGEGDDAMTGKIAVHHDQSLLLEIAEETARPASRTEPSILESLSPESPAATLLSSAPSCADAL